VEKLLQFKANLTQQVQDRKREGGGVPCKEGRLKKNKLVPGQN